MNKTEISTLGEFGLIEHLTRDIRLKNRSSGTGVGDDAAVLSYEDKEILITTDLLLEGIHFNLVYTPLKHLGYKAVVVNLSDIYAMNGQPKQITVSIGISSRFSLEEIETLYEGIKLACDRYKVDLVGGDTSSSLTGLTISITAIGEAEKKDLVFRNGARPNNLICVSGNLGDAYLGLQIMERENKLFEADPGLQPQLEKYTELIKHQLKPEARDDIITVLKEKGIRPTSMIDVSDGLSSDLLHILNASRCGCRIYADKIPITKEAGKAAKEFNMEPATAALNGGEDYELLFTVKLEDHEIISGLEGVHVIGHITEKDQGKKFITGQGDEIEIIARGWNHQER